MVKALWHLIQVSALLLCHCRTHIKLMNIDAYSVQAVVTLSKNDVE